MHENSTNPHTLIYIMALLVILIVCGLISTFNFLAGNILLVLGLLTFMFIVAKRHPNQFFPWLLTSLFFLLAITLSGLLQPWLLNNRPGLNYEQSLLIATLGGAVLSLLLTGLGYAGLVLAAAVAWDADDSLSLWEEIKYAALSLLGLPCFSVSIEGGGELKGKSKGIEQLTNKGGPGKIRVYPGQVVVLHKHGKITRAVGMGKTWLNRKERIKAIVPLGVQVNVNEPENVITRDRIALTVKVVAGCRIEPAAATDARLAELRQDPLSNQTTIRTLEALVAEGDPIGDELDECYPGIARLVAARAGLQEGSLVTDVASVPKGSVEVALRDVFMSNKLEDLFDGESDLEDIQRGIDNRQIDQIEKHITKNVKESRLALGVLLLFVDINGLSFPEDIQGKISEEVSALVDARIRETKTRIGRFEAEAGNTVLVSKAEAERDAARFRAEAIRIEGHANAQAKAELFEQVAQILVQQLGNNIAEIRPILEKLAAASVLEDDMRELLQLLGPQVRVEHLINNPYPEPSENVKGLVKLN